MITIEATCKFCGHALSLQFDLSDVKQGKVDIWKAMAACTPCADFHDRRLALEGWISRKAGRVTSDIIRNQLSKLTQAYAELICESAGIVVDWEPSFLETIIGNPEYSRSHLRHYWQLHDPTSFNAWQQARHRKP